MKLLISSSTLWNNFFGQLSNEVAIDTYTSTLEDNIFLAIELGKLSYDSIMKMPVNRFYNYINWKIKFDEDVARMKKEQLDS